MNWGVLVIGWFASVAALAGEFSIRDTHWISRPDHSEITYYLQRPFRHAARVPLLLVLQGSQFESVYNHSTVDGKFTERFATGLLMIEKPGVYRGSNFCGGEYLDLNTIDARVADIERVMTEIKKEPWWNGELNILAGSEGGFVAAKFQEKHAVKRAVLLITGGAITQREALPTVLRGRLRAMGASEARIALELRAMDRGLADIAKSPESTDETFAGCYSFKYWSAILDYRPVDSMLKTKTEFLLVHGTRDLDVPVASARATVAKFAAAGESARLTYREFEGLDHHLRNEAGESKMKPITDDALAWLFR